MEAAQQGPHWRGDEGVTCPLCNAEAREAGYLEHEGARLPVFRCEAGHLWARADRDGEVIEFEILIEERN